jgi:hypothetical protein
MRIVPIISAPAEDKITRRVKADTDFYRADVLSSLGFATTPSAGPFDAIWSPAPASPVRFNEEPTIVGGSMACVDWCTYAVAATEQISLPGGVRVTV